MTIALDLGGTTHHLTTDEARRVYDQLACVFAPPHVLYPRPSADSVPYVAAAPFSPGPLTGT